MRSGHRSSTVAGLLACATAFAVLILVEWDEPSAIQPLRLFRRWDFCLAAFITVYRTLGMMDTALRSSTGDLPAPLGLVGC